MDWIFDPPFLKFLAILLAIVALILFSHLMFKAMSFAYRSNFRKIGKEVERQGPVILAVFAIFLTYATVRMQTRLSGEISYQDRAELFIQLEMNNEYLMCLYRWHSYDDAAECRHTIVSDRIKYYQAMLYIEEVLYFVERSRLDRDIWGATYVSDLQFWIDDISEDPTGFFSYAIVVENPDNPLEAAEAAGLQMERSVICNNYRIVWGELDQAGANPAPMVDC